MPTTEAPARAAGIAVLPVPQATSSTDEPGRMPIRLTKSSAASEVKAAMRPKSPDIQALLHPGLHLREIRERGCHESDAAETYTLDARGPRTVSVAALVCVIVAPQAVKIEAVNRVSSVRKLGVVARVAGQQVKRSRTVRAASSAVAATARAFGKVMHQLLAGGYRGCFPGDGGDRRD